MRRGALWMGGLLVVAVAAAALSLFWILPRIRLQERHHRQETRREIAALPFVRAKADSGYTLVTGRRCAPLEPDTTGAVEFCLEKKAHSGAASYTFERYVYLARDSADCRVRPKTVNGWDCLP